MANFPGVYSNPRYTQSIIDLLMQRGDIAAQRAQQSGQLWGGAIAGLGQAVASGIQQHQEQKQQKERDTALMAFLDSGDWMKDPRIALSGSIKILGPREGPKFAEGLIGATKLMNPQGDPTEAMKALPMVARGLEAAPEALRPGLYGSIRGLMLNAKIAKPEDLPEQWDDSMRPMIQAIAYPEQQKAEAGFTLTPGSKRFGPKGEVIAEVPLAPPKPEVTLEEKVREAAALADARERVAQKYANTKASAEDQKKAQQFKSAVPVINAVSDLSEKINTLRGLTAKASGEIEKQKAKLNLNDNVAEYESLVMGFTPLVARALGHTGVLTEQDVQSVRMLFPRPEDSKSLRDRKITRLKGIMLQMPGIEPEAFSGASTPPKKNPFRKQ